MFKFTVTKQANDTFFFTILDVNDTVIYESIVYYSQNACTLAAKKWLSSQQIRASW